MGLFLAGANRASVALVVAIAATCYVAAAAFSLPGMAWAWIPLSFVVVLAGALVGLDPLVATAGAAAVLVVVGLLRGAARPALTLEAADLLLYGSIAVGALLLAPTAGLVVVAVTLVAHGIWDLWHLRRHRDLVSPSLEGLRGARRPARPGCPRRSPRVTPTGRKHHRDKPSIKGHALCDPVTQRSVMGTGGAAGGATPIEEGADRVRTFHHGSGAHAVARRGGGPRP